MLTEKWPIRLIVLARALTVGIAYFSVIGIPGLTSSFVAIFVALLPFDLIVAMPKIWTGWSDWKKLLVVIIPRVSGTALTLGKGLGLGIVGGLAVQLGLPVWLGSVFVVGLAYSSAIATRGNISSYVGMLGGLAVFDKIIRVELESASLFNQVAPVVLQTVYGTFSALVAGWLVGIGAGIATRAFLPRGYRTVKSSAYALPLEMQPFREVLGINGDMALAEAKIGMESDLCGVNLRSSGLKENYGAHVLVIHRNGKDIAMPGGDETLEPGDSILLLAPSSRISDAANMVKGSVQCA